MTFTCILDFRFSEQVKFCDCSWRKSVWEMVMFKVWNDFYNNKLVVNFLYERLNLPDFLEDQFPQRIPPFETSINLCSDWFGILVWNIEPTGQEINCQFIWINDIFTPFHQINTFWGEFGEKLRWKEKNLQFFLFNWGVELQFKKISYHWMQLKH